MRLPFIIAYLLAAALLIWAALGGNSEFLLYGITVLAVVALLHRGDRSLHFSVRLLWGVNVWILLHILGGLLPVGDSVLYSWVMIDLVGPPYSILKYDQLVHIYCYFIVSMLLWQVTLALHSDRSFALLATITVLATCGIGSLNEIVEFATTVLVADTNVGDYTNTALDSHAISQGPLQRYFFQGKSRNCSAG